MSIQKAEGIERQMDSEVITLNPDEQDDEESFGDLEDDNAAIQEESGQRIVIDEDTMESNDLLIDPKLAPQKPDHPAPTPHL
jgi:selenophosphate synthetase-related protein